MDVIEALVFERKGDDAMVLDRIKAQAEVEYDTIR